MIAVENHQFRVAATGFSRRANAEEAHFLDDIKNDIKRAGVGGSKVSTASSVQLFDQTKRFNPQRLAQ